MRRINMSEGFTGEPTRAGSLEHDDRGCDKVTYEVVGGSVSCVVDADVPDSEVADHVRHIQGEIELENGKVLRFQFFYEGSATAGIVDENAGGVPVRATVQC